jgi:hypothetical protein
LRRATVTKIKITQDELTSTPTPSGVSAAPANFKIKFAETSIPVATPFIQAFKAYADELSKFRISDLDNKTLMKK